ncbi:glycosyltransferase family 25 protein [Candidatus Pacearchaeota archaeon]|nr:glycosyltransferase family 25 protein [Candidatus Pacearchaeota archaeon]
MIYFKDLTWKILHIGIVCEEHSFWPRVRYYLYCFNPFCIRDKPVRSQEIRIDSMPFYFISSKKDSFKYVHMEKEFKKSLISNYIWVKAIDKNIILHMNLSRIYSDSKSVLHYGRSLSIGEIGCFLSHLKIWKEIVKKKLKYAIICEDDISFRVSKKELGHRLSYLPKNTDVFYLDIRANKLIFANKYYSFLPNKGEQLIGSACYFVTLNGARKLVSGALPVQMAVDDYLGRANFRSGVKLLMSSKPLVHNHGYTYLPPESSFGSEIEPERRLKREKIINLQRKTKNV